MESILHILALGDDDGEEEDSSRLRLLEESEEGFMVKKGREGNWENDKRERRKREGGGVTVSGEGMLKYMVYQTHLVTRCNFFY